MSDKKQTVLGEIPAHWQVLKIDAIKSPAKYAVAMGPFGSNIKASNFVPSGVPVIRGTNLNYPKYVDGEFVFLTEAKAQELKGSLCKPGDLIFTHRGTIGQVGLIPSHRYPSYVVSQSGMKLSVDPTIANAEFLFYFFKTATGQYQILQYESQVGVPSISNPLTSLKEIDVPVPPLAEQQAIADVLSSLDTKIDLLHRQNTTLEAMAETLFRQWFIEEAREDWDDQTIYDVTVINNVSVNSDYPHDTILYLDTGSLTNGKISGFQEYLFDQAPSRARRLVQHNDILISTVRPDQRHFGIIKLPVSNLVVSTGFCVLSCINISPYFIYLFLTLPEMTEYLHSIAEGSTSTYPSLRPSDIGGLIFKRPPEDVLEQFHAIVDSLWNKITYNLGQIQKLEHLRDTLLPKLMSGEVHVAY